MSNQEMINEGYKIRTIGLCQPFASAMLYGKIESRWVKDGHKPAFPLGLYMIYSTQKGYTASQIKDISGQHASYLFHVLKDEQSLPDGEPICIGQLLKVRHYEPLKDGPLTFVDNKVGLKYQIISDEETKVTHQLWCLEFSNIQRIEPFPFTGKQGVGLIREDKRKLIKII